MANPVQVVNQDEESSMRKDGKYLGFTLASEGYGIGILTVKEIIGMLPITAVPRTPDCIKGVVNLRGKVIPVLDLRARFGMGHGEQTERTCIIVVEVEMKEGEILVGIVVDSVSEVLNIKAEDIQDAPSFGANVDTTYILGMAKIGKDVKMLLDIQEVLSAEDFMSLKHVD